MLIELSFGKSKLRIEKHDNGYSLDVSNDSTNHYWEKVAGTTEDTEVQKLSEALKFVLS